MTNLVEDVPKDTYLNISKDSEGFFRQLMKNKTSLSSNIIISGSRSSDNNRVL